MVRQPSNRIPFPESSSFDDSDIDLKMLDIVVDYTKTRNAPLVTLPETPLPPSTLPPSPPPPPSTLLSSSLSLRHHPYFTVTKASRPSSQRGHSSATFQQNTVLPPLAIVHPPHVPVANLPHVSVVGPASVLGPS
ncbi:hypothetical protein BG015_005833 [Linnemannia schmuckeri]|uniref:Uncharacterized protein n=1 Tax=Linnemannia schmuckeri TaxID=64567 RepID=A0A9P5UW20_9FUNG|nr:hypothetical protein BG015_005833 [Linnemannia schmuckeri]